MITLLAASLALAPNPPVADANWVEVGRTPEVVVQFDTAHLERRGDVIRAWNWTHHAAPENGIADLYVQRDFDCAARTSTLIAARAVGPAGDVLRDYMVPVGEHQATPVVPATSAAILLDIACRGAGITH